jgi:hypothetical protein
LTAKIVDGRRRQQSHHPQRAGLEHQNLMNEDVAQEQVTTLRNLSDHLVLLAQASAATTTPKAASRS